MAGPARSRGRAASAPPGRDPRRHHATTASGLSDLSETEPTPPPAPLNPLEPRDGVPDVIVDPEALRDFAERLAAGSGPLALDAERASGYRYSQRAYLVQLRREGAGTALIDPIAVPDLSPVQEATSGVEWILHAATQDLGCLAEVGLRPDALFDTELAGRLLGRERVSLAALVGSELGFELQKGHGATDWSVRPLSSAQLRYAALDVEVLVELRNVMESELAAADKLDIAHQEFTSLLSFAPRDRGDDAWRRTSGIHRIRKPRDLAAVRALWMERDEIGRSRDVAIGRILPDASIVAAVQAHPGTVEDLASLREFHGRGAHRYLGRWWRALQAAASLPADQLPESAAAPSGPPQPRVWAERDPAAFARLEAARAGLSALSEQLTMPVENLLQPELVRRVCWEPPADVADLVATLERGSARGWQIERTLPVFEAALWPADPLGVTGE